MLREEYVFTEPDHHDAVVAMGNYSMLCYLALLHLQIALAVAHALVCTHLNVCKHTCINMQQL